MLIFLPLFISSFLSPAEFNLYFNELSGEKGMYTVYKYFSNHQSYVNPHAPDKTGTRTGNPST